MAVSAVESVTVEPYEDGAPYGDAGPYEFVRAVLRFTVDPTAAANRVIVDLDRARRDADGHVGFDADLVVLRPADPAAGNRTLLYSVANRGGVASLPFSVGAFAMPGASDRIEPGDGWLLRRGFCVAWSGWQWDVVRRPGMVGLAAPEALGDGGTPIAGDVRVEVQPLADTPTVRLAGLALDPSLAPPLPYPPAGLDQPGATLTVREVPDDEPTAIARDHWRFMDPDHVELDGGFDAGRVYEVTYRTQRCPVVGTGLLAVRDAVSWLRHAPATDGNPLASRVDYVLATGASQSGRFLRQFLHDGMNVDERGEQVFDGVHVHIAGGRRGEFNCRYGQPGVIWRGPGDTPPYTTNALLDRQRAVGGVPQVVVTNSAAEYWRGDAWLAHGDASGDHPVDVDDAAEVRHYLLAGVDHLGELGGLVGTMIPAVHPPNGTSATMLERALLAALHDWVRDDVVPPPSRVPRADDGTAAPREEVLRWFAVQAGVATPDPRALPRWGTGARGALVSAVGHDGNEVAGVRLPQLAVPAAVYTGWNVRPPLAGRPALLPDFLGSRLPLPAAVVGATGGATDGERARAAAEELVRERYLLADDVELVVGAVQAASQEASIPESPPSG